MSRKFAFLGWMLLAGAALAGAQSNPLYIQFIPGAVKGASEWFPKEERALATGIAIGGAAFGAVVAPPLTVWAVEFVGWRGAFFEAPWR